MTFFVSEICHYSPPAAALSDFQLSIRVFQSWLSHGQTNFDSRGEISLMEMVTILALTLSPTLNSLLVSLPTNL